MFAVILCCLVAIAADSTAWNMTAVAEVTLGTAWNLQARCIVIVQSSNWTAVESQDKFELAYTLSRARYRWQVGATTFPDIAHNLQHFTQVGHDACSKPIFVFFQTNTTQENLENLSKSYRFTNSVWLMITTSAVTEGFFSNTRIPLNSEWFQARMSAEGLTSLWEVYSIADRFPKQVVHVGEWSDANRIELTPLAMFRRRMNLQGHMLRTATLTSWPLPSFSDRTVSRRGESIDGFFSAMWYDLEDVMNFTSNNTSSAGRMSGKELPSGEWTGLLGLAGRGEVDALLSELTMTPGRLKIVEFIQPLIRTQHQVYFRFEGFVLDWAAMLHPFSKAVWLALGCLILGAALAIFVTDLTSAKMNLQQSWTWCTPSLVPAFFFVLQTFCSQGMTIVPKGVTLRWLFLLCYLIATIILPSYSGALISALTKKVASKPFDSLAELVVEKTPLLVWNNSADIELFSQARGTVYERVFPQVNPAAEMQELPGYTEMYNYMCENDNIAMFGVERYIDDYMFGLAKRKDIMGCWAVKFSEGLSPVYQTIGFARNSSYSAIINYNFLRMRESGLLHRYQMQYFPTWVDLSEPTFNVTMMEVAPTFTFLAGMAILSLAILAAEIYHPPRSTLLVGDWYNFKI